MAVESGTCAKLVTVAFVTGVAVGFILNTKLRKGLSNFLDSVKGNL